MRSFFPMLALGLLAVLATFSCSGNSSSEGASGQKYEVLSPWAEVDPIPVRGISPRVDTLAGKKIGLFANFKRAAIPIKNEVEKRLKERFPDAEFVLFHSTSPNVDESQTQNKEKFEAWARGVDAAVAMVAD
jgi:hypothetical protein